MFIKYIVCVRNHLFIVLLISSGVLYRIVPLTAKNKPHRSQHLCYIIYVHARRDSYTIYTARLIQFFYRKEERAHKEDEYAAYEPDGPAMKLPKASGPFHLLHTTSSNIKKEEWAILSPLLRQPT